MTAFTGAVGLGIRYLETDLHRTRDGALIAFHDHVLERLTNGVGRVADWRWEDLRHLDAAYWFDPGNDYPRRGKGDGVPLLEEVIAAFPDVCFNLDLKQPGIEADVAQFVARHGLWDRVLIASFHDRRIRRFRRLTGGRVATSAGPVEASAMWAASRAGRRGPSGPDAYQVPATRRIDRRFVEAAHRTGAQVHVWTVNDSTEMRRLLDLGVDGIVTDRPDLLNEVLAGEG